MQSDFYQWQTHSMILTEIFPKLCEQYFHVLLQLFFCQCTGYIGITVLITIRHYIGITIRKPIVYFRYKFYNVLPHPAGLMKKICKGLLSLDNNLLITGNSRVFSLAILIAAQKSTLYIFSVFLAVVPSLFRVANWSALFITEFGLLYNCSNEFVSGNLLGRSCISFSCKGVSYWSTNLNSFYQCLY